MIGSLLNRLMTARNHTANFVVSRWENLMPVEWIKSVAGTVLSFVLVAFTAINVQAEEPVFKAGAALVDISPPTFPIRTAGNLTLTIAEKSLDPLHVRAIALDDGATAAAIAVIDSCMVDRL